MQHSKIMGSKSLAEDKSTQIHSGSLLGSQQDPWDDAVVWAPGQALPPSPVSASFMPSGSFL